MKCATLARMSDTQQPSSTRTRRTPAQLEAEMRKRIETLRLRRIRGMYATATSAHQTLANLVPEATEIGHPSLRAIQAAVSALEEAKTALAEGQP